LKNFEANAAWSSLVFTVKCSNAKVETKAKAQL